MALKCACGGEIRETIDNKVECIICGITKKGDDKMAQIPEQTYAEIAEPFGKQFRDAIREAYARGYADGKRIGEMLREESSQEKRDRIVEKAKAELTCLKTSAPTKVSGWAYSYKSLRCDAEFIVNKEKRTVVALLKHRLQGRIVSKGIAKCAPGDCFNVHVGKAVALRKALEKDIVDYMDVPNPTEVRVGDIVTWELPNNTYVIEPGNRVINLQDGRDYTTYANLSIAKIIDDSREDVSE